MKKTAFLFPGQGAQYVGMAKDLHEADEPVRRLFEQCSDAAGIDISNLLFNSDEETLMQTENTQIAVMAASIAAAYALETRGVLPSLVAGFSLGEYAAMVVSGMIDVHDACNLVVSRGKIMERCGEKLRKQFPDEGGVGMTAVLGLAPADIEKHLQEWNIPRVYVAMHNSPVQAVLAGTSRAREAACEKLLAAGVKKAIPLKVSGPFHTPLMQEAKDEFAAVIAKVEFKEPRVPIFSNVSGARVATCEDMRTLCLEQLVHPVRWIDEERAVADETPEQVLEAGPGNVLCGLWKAWRKDAPQEQQENLPECQPAGTLEHIAAITE